jgi:ABC-2 type transport system permease protein
MTAMYAAATARRSVRREEMTKLLAFFRRDLLISLSYRVAFVSDWVALLLQIGIFGILSRLVDPDKVPSYGGGSPSYLAFAAVGIAFSTFVQKSLTRIVTTTRTEQLMGTLESLLVTPTAAATLQLGSVTYDLLYVPLRTGVSLGLMAVVFDLHFNGGGLGPFMVILLTFLPFTWGIGLLSAATVLTARRSEGPAMAAISLMTLTSSAFLPLPVLPGWLQAIARLNPLTVALDGARNALLGNAGWSAVTTPVAVLVPAAGVTLGLGVVAFRLAVRRERRRGTLFLY